MVARAVTSKAPKARKSTAKRSKGRKKAPGLLTRISLLLRRVWRWMILTPLFLGGFAICLYAVVNPPTTHTIWSEARRLGGVDRTWVSIDQIAPVMQRSAVAAEDANFCRHWGFDVEAIRQALDDGSGRGASTITQQTVKNAYLWQGRSWVRKALEALLTPGVELVWSKRRILEVYLNVAEFREGVFGVEAGAQAAFGVSAANLTATQAARLAVALPNPKGRDPANLSPTLRKRAAQIADGAATIDADGRALCFEG